MSRAAATRHRDFWLHVDGARGVDFERVLGTRILPVKSPRPFPASLPGFHEPQLVYLLDLDWVRQQGRRENLVAHLAHRFGQPTTDVERALDEAGMPILAADTTLRIDNPQKGMG